MPQITLPSLGSWRWIPKLTLAGALLILTRVSPGVLAAPTNPGPNSQALVAHVSQAVLTLQAAARDLAATPLDEDGVIERVGRDPAKLCQWVRQRVAYEPYRGFLKGAEGALISHSANSADKSLLLGDLLVKAGFKVQLVDGAAAPGVQPPPAIPAPGADTVAPKALAVLSQRTGIAMDRILQMQQSAAAERDDFQERLWNRTLSDIQTVSTLLDRAHVPAPPAILAREDPADHWWVRTAAADLDPTFEGAPPKGGRAFDIGSLPPAEFHQATVKLLIRRDNTPSTVLQTSYRCADVFGRTFTVANVPLGISQKLSGLAQPTAASVLDLLTAATKFQPQVVLSGGLASDGSTVVNGKAFDLTGQQFDASQGQAQSAQQLGGGLGGLLGGAGGAKPVTKLTAAWIEIDLISPGQPAPTIVRRDLFVDAAGLSARQKVLDLLATREVLLLPEDISDDYATALTLKTVAGWAQYLSTHAKKDLGATVLGAFAGRPQFTAPLYAFGVVRRAALRRLCDGRFAAAKFAHAGPTAVSYVMRFIDGPSPIASIGIDILNNALVPAAASGKPTEPGWGGNFGLACGMLDTALEHEILRAGQTHQNASVSLESSMLDGAGPVVVRGALPPDLKLSQTALASIRPDLARAVFVVVPGAPAAWYRISLDTGMTLGYIEGGGGQEASEYAEMAEVMNQLIEMIQFYANLGRCAGAAISNPLVGKNDMHENLTDCFKAACSMVPGAVGQLVGVDTSWTNLIINKTIGSIWEKVCDKLWDKVGGGEGG